MISPPGTLWGCIGSLDMLGYKEMKSLTSSQEPSLGVSRQNITNKIQCWVDNQHLLKWYGPNNTQRQARKLILGPSPTTKARFLSFNRTQSRVVTVLHTGHNTLRRHFCLMGLINNPTCWKCDTEEETAFHILCECEAYFTQICISGLLLLGP